jgi:hypothetical protein
MYGCSLANYILEILIYLYIAIIKNWIKCVVAYPPPLGDIFACAQPKCSLLQVSSFKIWCKWWTVPNCRAGRTALSKIKNRVVLGYKAPNQTSGGGSHLVKDCTQDAPPPKSPTKDLASIIMLIFWGKFGMREMQESSWYIYYRNDNHQTIAMMSSKEIKRDVASWSLLVVRGNDMHNILSVNKFFCVRSGNMLHWYHGIFFCLC